MRRLVIAVDCDDVLVATTPFFIGAYNAQFGTHISLADSHNESEVVWSATRAQQLERLDALTKTDAYFAIKPSAEESAVLQELATTHMLHVVTARKPEELERTQAMIDRDLPGVFSSLDFVGWNGSKGAVCERISADVLIDDSVRNLVDAAECGVPTDGLILFGDYPWNQDVPAQLAGIRRCANWHEVRSAIHDIANR